MGAAEVEERTQLEATMAADCRRRQMTALLLPLTVLLVVSPAHSFTHPHGLCLQGSRPSILSQKGAPAHRPGTHRVSMGAREGFMEKARVLKAAVAIFGSVWIPKAVVAAPPPMQNVYPASYYMQKADLDEEELEMHPIAKFVTDKRFLTTVGVGVVAGGAVVTVRKWRQKSMEDYRKKLSSFSDIKLDASILDEGRINRPGSKTMKFSNSPTFGTYRPPPENKMKGIKDKYVWNEKKKPDEDLESKLRVDIFNTPSTPNTNATQPATGSAVVDVEVVGADEGPRTSTEKAMADALGDFDYNELMNQAMMDPSTIDPSVMAGVLPKLQEQMAAVLKDGVNPEDVEEVRASFREMGIDLEELFSSIEDLEKAGLAGETLGKEGVEFFRTLREILNK